MKTRAGVFHCFTGMFQPQAVGANVMCVPAEDEVPKAACPGLRISEKFGTEYFSAILELECCGLARFRSVSCGTVY